MTRVASTAALVKNRNFLALWLGQLVSSFGDNLLHINVMAFALTAHQAAGGVMANILIWATLPALGVGLIAGVIIDRSNRKSVMIVSDLVRAGLIAVLPCLAPSGLWSVYAVIALVACASSFFGSAKATLIPVTVTAEQLVAANAWFSASGFVVALIGTAAGGWMLAGLGARHSLWINAAIFAGSALAVSVARIRTAARAPRDPVTLRTVLRELGVGWTLTLRHRVIRTCVLHAAALMGLVTALYVGIVGTSGHAGVSALHGLRFLLTAAVGGVIIGGLLAHQLSRRFTRQRLLTIGLSAIGTGALGAALSHDLLGMMGWLAVIGVGAAIYSAVVDAMSQRAVPDHLRGRMGAVRGIACNLMVIVSAAAAGALIDRAGSAVLFGVIAASACLVLVGMGIVTPPGLLFRATRSFFRHVGFAYLRLSISGLRHIPARGPVIIAGNHPNVLDGILLLIISPRPVRFLVAEELFFHRYLHPFFRGMGCIPVYRRAGATNGDSLRAAVEALQRGEVVGIFPEGTTSYLGDMRAVKSGVAVLALKTGAPVVPMGIWGSAEVYPTGVRVPRPGRIAISFAPPVRYIRTLVPTLPPEMLDRVKEDLRWEILRTMRWSMAAFEMASRPWMGKPVQVILSALVVIPLANFLQATANPSLDPVSKERK